VLEPPDHRSPRHALAPAATAPPVGLDHPASQHRPIGLQPLPDHDETKFVQAAERRQIRVVEGSVGHVEVFRMGSVRTSILGDLDPYPGTTATPSSAMSQFLSAQTELVISALELFAAWRDEDVGVLRDLLFGSDTSPVAEKERPGGAAVANLDTAASSPGRRRRFGRR